MASDSPRTVNAFLVFVGSLAAFAGVIIVVVGLLALNRPDSANSLEKKRAAQRIEVATKLEREAQEKLHSAGWVDKAKGLAHVPVADALPIVVAELKAKKPAPSQVKVDPPLSMPVIDPKATEPPPPALTSAPQGADTIRFAPPATPEPATPVAAPPAAPVPASAAPVPAPVVPAPSAPAPASPAPPAPATPDVAPPKPEPAPRAVPTPPAPAPEAPATPAPANPNENSAPTK